jgi:hypothetical protein
MSVSQNRAIASYRARLHARGLTRFEVLGRETDRDLVRKIARRLAEEGPDTQRLRATLTAEVMGGPTTKGGILAALRRSPLVGADLDLTRPYDEGRAVDL